MAINQRVNSKVSTPLIYEDDIKAKEEVNGEQITVGPKLQLKQALGIGVVYVFLNKKNPEESGFFILKSH